MISGRIIGEVVQDGVAHYKKRREIHYSMPVNILPSKQGQGR